MNIQNAIKLVCAGIDYKIEQEEARDAIEKASIVLQKAFGFDSNDVKCDLLDWEHKIKKYLK